MSHTLLSAILLALSLGQTSSAASPPVDLGSYYVHLQPSSPPLTEGWFDKNATTPGALEVAVRSYALTQVTSGAQFPAVPVVRMP